MQFHERVRALEGVQNFRDYGGYACARGALPRGVLYRSAHLAGATDADVEHIGGLGLAVIVDLRRTSERLRDPNRLHKDFCGELIESDAGPAAHAPHMAFLEQNDLTPALAARVMTDFYRNAPFDAVQCELARRYFHALAEAEGPVLLHCAAGKDRTGFLVAVTHAALGVHEDDLMADYVLTNAATRTDARLEELTRVMKALYQRNLPEPVIRAFLTVSESYLASSFAAICESFGSVESYLAEHVGVDTALLERVEAKLVA